MWEAWENITARRKNKKKRKKKKRVDKSTDTNKGGEDLCNVKNNKEIAS